MAERTCKPDADFKRLWRTLFPGTPFPSCGTGEESDAVAHRSTGSTINSSDGKPSRKRDEAR
jgi:hypothetical protein